MDFFAWIIVGLIAGFLASLVMKTNRKQGIILDIIVGVVGAFIGGFVLDTLGLGGDVSGINLPTILTAFVGAVILLAVLRLFSGRRRR
jgi:uncharacterized membrane protein YeaQ/YmgE (transglycosylase-associated protein family)